MVLNQMKIYGIKWLEFLSTDVGKALLPDWRRLTLHAENYVAS